MNLNNLKVLGAGFKVLRLTIEWTSLALTFDLFVKNNGINDITVLMENVANCQMILAN